MAMAVSAHRQQSTRVRPCTFETETMSKEKKSFYQSSSSSPPTAESKTAMPSWLLSTIADLDERMKAAEVVNSEEDSPDDTFGQRAESYYKKRPQLLSLLQDLYNAYLSLSDRYLRGLKRRSSRSCVKQSPSLVSLSDQEDAEVYSEAESSISYQKPAWTTSSGVKANVDSLITELVMKNVEHDLLLHEVNLMEQRRGESAKKIEIQDNLLDLLESERIILLRQNAALGFQVAALEEENQLLATESELMKTRAAELAKCVWKIREEGCVGELSIKIEDLQDRIFDLEKTNKEYYHEIVRREMQLKGGIEGSDAALLGCFEFDMWKQKRERAARRKAIQDKKAGLTVGKRKATNWWTKVKKMDIFKCGTSNPGDL